MDPSGTFVQCDARAIGSASEGAQSSLQEVYHKVGTRQIPCVTLHNLNEAHDTKRSLFPHKGPQKMQISFFFSFFFEKTVFYMGP